MTITLELTRVTVLNKDFDIYKIFSLVDQPESVVTGDMVTAARGKGFQYRRPDGDWVACDCGGAAWPTDGHYEYRRCQPQLLSRDDIDLHKAVFKSDEDEMIAIGKSDEGVWFFLSSDTTTWAELYDCYTWKPDGTGEWLSCEKIKQEQECAG